MVQLVLIAAGTGLIVLAATIPLIGLWRVLSLLLLVTLALVPYPLWTNALAQPHFGIADGDVVPMTYSLAIAAVLIAGLRDRGIQRSIVLSAGVFVYLAILTTLLWGDTTAQWSGVLHLVTALLGVGAGAAIARSMLSDGKLRLLWAGTVLGIFLIQGVLVGLQLAGIPASLFDIVHYFNQEHRPIASFNHPSVIGKTVLVLFLTLFPLTRDAHTSTRRYAWAAIVLGVALTAATQARSNIAAVLVAVVLWVLFDNRYSLKRRLVAAGVVAAACLPVALVVIPRFLMDPGGGDRAELLATGLGQIFRQPWFGIGVNSYSDVVGQWDELAAQGLPVHVTVLLAIAELGVFGALFLFSPLIWQLISAGRTWGSTGFARSAAVATFATLPGLALVTITGWGMLTEGSLVLWYLTVGMSIGMMNQSSAQAAPATQRASSAHSTR